MKKSSFNSRALEFYQKKFIYMLKTFNPSYPVSVFILFIHYVQILSFYFLSDSDRLTNKTDGIILINRIFDYLQVLRITPLILQSNNSPEIIITIFLFAIQLYLIVSAFFKIVVFFRSKPPNNRIFRKDKKNEKLNEVFQELQSNSLQKQVIYKRVYSLLWNLFNYIFLFPSLELPITLTKANKAPQLIAIAYITAIMSIICSFIVSFHDFQHSFEGSNLLVKKETIFRYFTLIEVLQLLILKILDYGTWVKASILVFVILKIIFNLVQYRLYVNDEVDKANSQLLILMISVLIFLQVIWGFPDLFSDYSSILMLCLPILFKLLEIPFEINQKLQLNRLLLFQKRRVNSKTLISEYSKYLINEVRHLDQILQKLQAHGAITEFQADRIMGAFSIAQFHVQKCQKPECYCQKGDKIELGVTPFKINVEFVEKVLRQQVVESILKNKLMNKREEASYLEILLVTYLIEEGENLCNSFIRLLAFLFQFGNEISLKNIYIAATMQKKLMERYQMEKEQTKLKKQKQKLAILYRQSNSAGQEDEQFLALNIFHGDERNAYHEFEKLDFLTVIQFQQALNYLLQDFLLIANEKEQFYESICQDFIDLEDVNTKGKSCIQNIEKIEQQIISLMNTNITFQVVDTISTLFGEFYDFKKQKISNTFRHFEKRFNKQDVSEKLEFNFLFNKQSFVIHVSLLNQIGVIQQLSQSQTSILGYDRQLLIGHDFQIIMENFYHDLHQDAIQKQKKHCIFPIQFAFLSCFHRNIYLTIPNLPHILFEKTFLLNLFFLFQQCDSFIIGQNSKLNHNSFVFLKNSQGFILPAQGLMKMQPFETDLGIIALFNFNALHQKDYILFGQDGRCEGMSNNILEEILKVTSLRGTESSSNQATISMSSSIRSKSRSNSVMTNRAINNLSQLQAKVNIKQLIPILTVILHAYEEDQSRKDESLIYSSKQVTMLLPTSGKRWDFFAYKDYQKSGSKQKHDNFQFFTQIDYNMCETLEMNCELRKFQIHQKYPTLYFLIINETRPPYSERQRFAMLKNLRNNIDFQAQQSSLHQTIIENKAGANKTNIKDFITQTLIAHVNQDDETDNQAGGSADKNQNKKNPVGIKVTEVQSVNFTNSNGQAQENLMDYSFSQNSSVKEEAAINKVGAPNYDLMRKGQEFEGLQELDNEDGEKNKEVEEKLSIHFHQEGKDPESSNNNKGDLAWGEKDNGEAADEIENGYDQEENELADQKYQTELISPRNENIGFITPHENQKKERKTGKETQSKKKKKHQFFDDNQKRIQKKKQKLNLPLQNQDKRENGADRRSSIGSSTESQHSQKTNIITYLTKDQIMQETWLVGVSTILVFMILLVIIVQIYTVTKASVAEGIHLFQSLTFGYLILQVSSSKTIKNPIFLSKFINIASFIISSASLLYKNFQLLTNKSNVFSLTNQSLIQQVAKDSILLSQIHIDDYRLMLSEFEDDQEDESYSNFLLEEVSYLELTENRLITSNKGSVISFLNKYLSNIDNFVYRDGEEGLEFINHNHQEFRQISDQINELTLMKTSSQVDDIQTVTLFTLYLMMSISIFIHLVILPLQYSIQSKRESTLRIFATLSQQGIHNMMKSTNLIQKQIIKMIKYNKQKDTNRQSLLQQQQHQQQKRDDQDDQGDVDEFEEHEKKLPHQRRTVSHHSDIKFNWGILNVVIIISVLVSSYPIANVILAQYIVQNLKITMEEVIVMADFNARVSYQIHTLYSRMHEISQGFSAQESLVDNVFDAEIESNSQFFVNLLALNQNFQETHLDPDLYRQVFINAFTINTCESIIYFTNQINYQMLAEDVSQCPLILNSVLAKGLFFTFQSYQEYFENYVQNIRQADNMESLKQILLMQQVHMDYVHFQSFIRLIDNIIEILSQFVFYQSDQFFANLINIIDLLLMYIILLLIFIYFLAGTWFAKRINILLNSSQRLLTLIPIDDILVNPYCLSYINSKDKLFFSK